MKNIWLNILAFAAFLAIEITAVSFMSTYSAISVFSPWFPGVTASR